MQRRGFLLLMAVCAIATALPRHKSSEDTGASEDSTNVSENTTVKQSKMITVTTVTDMSKKISEAGDKLVILFIMSNNCGLSQWIAPNVEDIANTMDNVVVLKVPVKTENTKEEAKIQTKYHEYFDFEANEGVQLPIFGFLKNGSKLEHYANGSDIKKLRDTVAKYITAEH